MEMDLKQKETVKSGFKLDPVWTKIFCINCTLNFPPANTKFVQGLCYPIPVPLFY